MMLYLARAHGFTADILIWCFYTKLPCTRATASPNSVKSAMRGNSWRSMSLMFIVACTLAWFRADKGLYALIERAMAYCWLRYWDKKRYNQTAIPFSFTFPIKWERVSCLRFKRKCLFYIQLKKLAIV